MIDPAVDCWDALGEADRCGAPLLPPILLPARQGRVGHLRHLAQGLPESYAVHTMEADTLGRGLLVA